MTLRVSGGRKERDRCGREKLEREVGECVEKRKLNLLAFYEANSKDEEEFVLNRIQGERGVIGYECGVVKVKKGWVAVLLCKEWLSLSA